MTPNTATLHTGPSREFSCALFYYYSTLPSDCRMSSYRDMTGFVPAVLALFPVPYDLLVGPSVRIVQHTRQETQVAVSNFPTRRALGFHSTTTKADGMIRFFPAVRVLTPTIGMLWSAPTKILKYGFGLEVPNMFLARLNSRRPMALLNQMLGYVLPDTDTHYVEIPDSVHAGYTCCCLVE